MHLWSTAYTTVCYSLMHLYILQLQDLGPCTHDVSMNTDADVSGLVSPDPIIIMVL